MSYIIRDFQPDDQDTVYALIIEGLGQRFDEVKPEYNPDLLDIQAKYIQQGASFIVLEVEGEMIACGALIKEHGSNEVARIVRVSVRADQQGKGLGRIISDRLIVIAKDRRFSKIVVETNDDWTSALRLYQACGFTETHRVKSEYDYTELHMELAL